VRPRRLALVVLCALGLAGLVAFGIHTVRRLEQRAQVLDSGGPLSALEAAYDVRRYELAITLHPERRTIDGRLTATVVATTPLERFELDLDRRLEVASVAVDALAAPFAHRRGKLEIGLARPWSPGERHRVTVVYGGRPKVSTAPPWIDGFVWAKTPSGAPWVGVTCEIDGADDWWPTKDHPSDEPDEGMAIELTVPPGLVGLANGHELATDVHPDGSTTSRWEVAAPINNYLVTVAAGPYVELDETYRGIDGTLAVPMRFWVLPEHRGLGRTLWREAPRIVTTFAGIFGEFPFLADKIGAVEEPFDGMEHQTLLALGDGLTPAPSGRYDTLVHELAHEWWGNKVTARDWDDFWIHEGFSTYAEVLYVERSEGAEAARDDLEQLRTDIRNQQPLVAGRPRTAAAAYDPDIYDKGAWVLATLRWQLGDAAFFQVLREFSGPPEASRLVDSAELERLVARIAGRDLSWFWRRYLERADLPRYRMTRITRHAEPAGDHVCFRWNSPDFELALPVAVGDQPPLRLEMPRGGACLDVAPGVRVEVEPAGRILAEPAAIR
jgi:aminopeptidase N